MTNIEDLSSHGGQLQRPEPGARPEPGGDSRHLRRPDRPRPAGVKEQVGVYLDESVISLSLFTPDSTSSTSTGWRCCAGRRAPSSAPARCPARSATSPTRRNSPASKAPWRPPSAACRAATWAGDLKGMVNMPLSPTAALRIDAYGSQFPGFIDAIQPGARWTRTSTTATGPASAPRCCSRPATTSRSPPRLIYQKTDVDGFNRVDIFNILGNRVHHHPPARPARRHEAVHPAAGKVPRRVLPGRPEPAVRHGRPALHLDLQLHRPRRAGAA